MFVGLLFELQNIQYFTDFLLAYVNYYHVFIMFLHLIIFMKA